MNTLHFAISNVILSLGLLSALGLPGQALETVKTAQQGSVRAELSYQKPEKDFLQYSKIRLKISRSGQTVFDQPSKADEYDRPWIDITDGSTEFAESGFKVQDLDGDQEPEIITDFFTGGAHCCTYSLIYRYDAAKKTYVQTDHFWGDVGYRLQDVDGNGTIEFRSANPGFAYAFASFAGSAFPIQIWRYDRGNMIDETRRYPKQVYADAYQKWQFYVNAGEEDGEVKGLLAAYMADKYLLNQQEDGWKRLRATYKGRDRNQFFTELSAFLRETGYVVK
ncbi:hypothetical protein [Myxacorys almedinensis]|uniref:Uncharacterized protein n=1 Tax=Myxacorys almedinensis A TaxID=2690445 RepID=A0A8J7Z6M0_9CYAN|nr:hypothetical protein [Myxacorys almedinensis]NDJ19126.1 hypothetical protein [Myxacorys almedinensis A]